MKYDRDRHHRQSIRLPGYDYSQLGAYFVTLCTHERACLFGEIIDGVMHPNPLAEIVREQWFHTAMMRPNVRLYDSEFVVMPNHIHGIIWILDAFGTIGATVGATCWSPLLQDIPRPPNPKQPNGPKSGSIGAILAGFKSATTKRINQQRGTPGLPVWQRNYYEHIIRNETTLNQIRQYILDNPR
jgi:REP element-mobilizing transposase RayT